MHQQRMELKHSCEQGAAVMAKAGWGPAPLLSGTGRQTWNEEAFSFVSK